MIKGFRYVSDAHLRLRLRINYRFLLTAKSPAYALELLRRTSSNLSEDFFECSGEPVARTLRAFRGLLTDVLALIRRLRAYSLCLFGGHFRTLDSRVLDIFSLVTDLTADVFRLLASGLCTLDRRVLHIASLVTDLSADVFRLLASGLCTL